MTKSNYPNLARVKAHTLTGEEKGGKEKKMEKRGTGRGKRKIPAIKTK